MIPDQKLTMAIHQAVAEGWTFALREERWAILHGVNNTSEKPAVGTGFHVANAVATLLTFGLWGPVWLVLWLVMGVGTSKGQRGRSLIVKLNDADEIEFELRTMVEGQRAQVRS